VVNVDWYFISHRLPLARAALDGGLSVHVATAVTSPQCRMALLEARLVLHELPDVRQRKRVFGDLHYCRRLWRVLRKVQPDVVHLVTAKPIIYGGILARFLKRTAVLSAVPGLGFAFVHAGLWSTVRRVAILTAYRVALRHARQRVIFQNAEDRELFVRSGIASERDTVIVRGAGVDLEKFSASAEPAGTVTVLMACRLLREKGVREFLAAASLLHGDGVDAKWVLVGDIDPGNPGSLSRAEVASLLQSTPVVWHGFQSDMTSVLRDCNIVCLPTYYGEGVPKILIEAAASARPCVTTDIPGCRDVVRDGVNGLLVPPRDVRALAQALRTLIESPAKRLQFGAAGRSIVERDFSLPAVVDAFMSIYRELLGTAPAECVWR
jgi:glycosyltransferase involved in cell wall biosynthesis